MKKTYVILTAFILLIGMTLISSCTKDNDETSDLATLNQEQSSDEENVGASSDAIDDDLENIMSYSSLKSTESVVLPCHLNIDSSLIASKKFTITFNGENCNGTFTRTGTMEITLTGNHWSDAGAVLTVKYTNLKITRIANQKYVILNGTKTHTNVSGGLVRWLGQTGTPDAIVRKIESNDMKITFTNGTERNWNISRTRSFSKVEGNVKLTVTGSGTADGKTNLVEWGTNRRGTAFYSQITSPIVMSQACDYKPSAGEKIHYVGLRTVDVILGTDETGTPVNNGCATHYKISWTGVGGEKTAILPY